MLVGLFLVGGSRCIAPEGRFIMAATQLRIGPITGDIDVEVGVITVVITKGIWPRSGLMSYDYNSDKKAVTAFYLLLLYIV